METEQEPNIKRVSILGSESKKSREKLVILTHLDVYLIITHAHGFHNCLVHNNNRKLMESFAGIGSISERNVVNARLWRIRSRQQFLRR